jgi:hypothetical protein
MPDEVWVLDFEATGPEGGDYTGHQSVHHTPEGADARLQEQLRDLGVDIDSAEVIASARADNGSFTADLEVDGMEISYGVHRMPVEP